MLIKSAQKKIYRILASLRWNAIRPWLNTQNKTLLDVGGSDFSVYGPLAQKFKITTCDIKPKKGILKQDVQKLTFKDNSFDTVVSVATLEHIQKNKRSKFLEELKRVSKKKILIRFL